MTLLEISFPAIDPIALELGPIVVRWYGLAYAAGLILGWLYIRALLSDGSLWPDHKAPMSPDDVDELLVFVTAGVILGGRLGHVLFYHPGFYFANPLEILAIWKGGMAFHGGLIGTGIGMWLFARRRGISLWPVADLVSAAVPIGLFFGRVANFINAEVVGSPSSLPWAMVFPNAGPEARHPAMLYEAALEGIALFLLLRYLTHTLRSLKTPGLTTGVFLLAYGAFRIFCELFKIVDYRQIIEGLPITYGMIYSIPMLAVGAWAVHRARTAKRAELMRSPG
ncbi:MAG: prolipoprotein diacylglyceryl transferase [Alphaproteobacteria bacterium]|nr:prolipoprotein diacylglyceryl transferase [Alphaproteobacteria bacterium]